MMADREREDAVDKLKKLLIKSQKKLQYVLKKHELLSLEEHVKLELENNVEYQNIYDEMGRLRKDYLHWKEKNESLRRSISQLQDSNSTASRNLSEYFIDLEHARRRVNEEQKAFQDYSREKLSLKKESEAIEEARILAEKHFYLDQKLQTQKFRPENNLQEEVVELSTKKCDDIDIRNPTISQSNQTEAATNSSNAEVALSTTRVGSPVNQAQPQLAQGSLITEVKIQPEAAVSAEKEMEDGKVKLPESEKSRYTKRVSTKSFCVLPLASSFYPKKLHSKVQNKRLLLEEPSVIPKKRLSRGNSLTYSTFSVDPQDV